MSRTAAGYMAKALYRSARADLDGLAERLPHSKVIHPLFPKDLFENAAFGAR